MITLPNNEIIFLESEDTKVSPFSTNENIKKLYVGRLTKHSSNKLPVENGDLFVTPHPGIASIFIIDKNKVKEHFSKKVRNINYHYDEWFSSKLDKPFKEVHVTVEGDPDFEEFVYTGYGYIYEINADKYRDDLRCYSWMEESKEAVIINQKFVEFTDCKMIKVTFIVKGGESKTVIESADSFEEELEMLFEAANDSYLFKEYFDNMVNSVLSDPQKDRKFRNCISGYINRNINKLTTAGPQYMIPFGEKDKAEYWELFNTSAKEITKVTTSVINEIKKGASTSSFLLLKQNPIFMLFYFCIRYYTLKNDSKGLNNALAIYALAVYPSIFAKYFPYEPNPAVMQYTIDNLTDKFLIKQKGHIFATLVESIQRSYTFLKPNMKNASDANVVQFVQRIRNDQNSLLKKIASQYMKNWEEGKGVSTRLDSYDGDAPILDDVENNTASVQNVVNKVTLPIIQNGIDLVRAEAAAKMAQIGVSDCRFYLTRIMIDKNINDLRSFIEALLFLYLYEEHKSQRDINSSYFLTWSASLFKKTNSKNPNIIKINTLLDKWAEDSGIYDKYKRLASRINYKKAIFFYIVLCIQKYNG